MAASDTCVHNSELYLDRLSAWSSGSTGPGAIVAMAYDPTTQMVALVQGAAGNTAGEAGAGTRGSTRGVQVLPRAGCAQRLNP